MWRETHPRCRRFGLLRLGERDRFRRGRLESHELPHRVGRSCPSSPRPRGLPYDGLFRNPVCGVHSGSTKQHARSREFPCHERAGTGGLGLRRRQGRGLRGELHFEHSKCNLRRDEQGGRDDLSAEPDGSRLRQRERGNFRCEPRQLRLRHLRLDEHGRGHHPAN